MSTTDPARPSLPMRVAAGAWHVPAGFGFLAARPRLWPLAALPALLTVALVFLGLVLGVFAGPRVVERFGPAPGGTLWVELAASLLLWTAILGSGVFLGLGVALLLSSPLLEVLSRRVEADARGQAAEGGRGLAWEAGQAVRGSLYFIAAAPFVFLLGLVPLVGPLLSLAWGGQAVAFQMTDPALTRRGLTFGAKRRWHRGWRAESLGFGLAGMVGLLVPFANLLLGPALVAGGTLLVLSLEEVGGPSSRGTPPAPGDEGPAVADPSGAGGEPPSG